MKLRNRRKVPGKTLERKKGEPGAKSHRSRGGTEKKIIA